MKVAREIKIQRLQTKNRMVGQTFNPNGHTSDSLSQREKNEIDLIKNLSDLEYEKRRLFCVFDDSTNHSNLFETNVFIRNFGLQKR